MYSRAEDAGNTSIASNASVHVGTADGLMMFGFLCGFTALVLFFYQHESKLLMRCFATSLAVLAVYGFILGQWAVSMLVVAWSVSTLRRTFGVNPTAPAAQAPRQRSQKNQLSSLTALDDCESRISRMFGPR